MRNLMFPHVKILGGLCALVVGVPALATPAAKPTTPAIVNDDTRVGAPAVIVAPPAVKPITPPNVTPSPATPKKVAAPFQATPPVPVVAAKAAPQLATVPPVKVLPLQAAPPKLVTTLPPRAPTPLPVQASAPPVPRPAPAMLSQAASLASVQADRREQGPVAAVYHRPEYGYRIPAEWTAPDYFIADFDSYDLPRPAQGFGWSRYYDDAVLTDQWGRVYDWREDVNWADHDPRYVGNRGPREGDSHSRKPRGKRYDYNGRWTGSWDGGPVQSYRGEWRGTVRPHWSGGYDGGYDGGNYGGNGGASYGYDSGGTTVTTVIIQAAAPVMTTQTISYDEISYVPVRAKAVRRWKPQPKPVCACGS